MTTKREAILDYLPAFLSTDETLDSLSVMVERSRRRPFPKDQRYALNIVPESDPRMDTGGHQYVDRRISIAFEIHVRGNNESAADPIVNALHNKLMSNRVLADDLADASTYRCRDIEATDNDFEWDDGDTDLCIVRQRYDITYRSSETDLSA